MSQQIHGRMIAVMRALSAIGKDKRNQQGGYQFRGIDDVYNAIHQHMAEAGVFCTMEVLDHRIEPRQFKNSSGFQVYSTVKYTFFAEDGSNVSSTVIGEAMDSGDKATNKTYAIAHKYALLQAFLIPTADMPDPDAETHELEQRKPLTAPPPVRDRITACRTVQELASLYNSLSSSEQSEYSPEFTAKKNAILQSMKKEAA